MRLSDKKTAGSGPATTHKGFTHPNCPSSSLEKASEPPKEKGEIVS